MTAEKIAARILQKWRAFVILCQEPPAQGVSHSFSFRRARFSTVSRRLLDHAAGRLPSFVSDAGFVDVAGVRRARTTYGTLAYLRARQRPAA